MMDKLVYARLIRNQDTELRGLIATRVYPRGSLGRNSIPAQPPKPYVMYGEDPSIAVSAVRETADASVITYVVYVYDAPGSYMRIKQIIQLIKETLVQLAGVRDTDGTNCLDFRYEGSGADTYEPTKDEFVKTAIFRAVATR